MSEAESPAEAWVRSGAAALSGWPDGPGLVPPRALLERIRALGETLGVDAFAALTERAAAVGLSRQGQVSCGGTTRLLQAADSWLAVTLARDDDVASVAAWLLSDGPGADPWQTVAEVVRHRPGAELVAQATLLGLPVAAVPPVECSTRPDGPLPGRRTGLGPGDRAPRSTPLVVDLSSLWAGPLCARILAEHGADVIKVESVRRPDGARRGPSAFFDRLHAGQRSVALDFHSDAGRRALRRLLETADVVIEASRPRALDQLELGPSHLGPDGPPIWVSITGYGRTGPDAERAAFGDDAAAAGGLLAPTEDGPVFVADAVADPLTGLAAAAAVIAILHGASVGPAGHVAAGHPSTESGSWLLDIPMMEVAAWIAEAGQGGSWHSIEAPPAPPLLAPARSPAPALGAHTTTVFAEMAVP